MNCGTENPNRPHRGSKFILTLVIASVGLLPLTLRAADDLFGLEDEIAKPTQGDEDEIQAGVSGYLKSYGIGVFPRKLPGQTSGLGMQPAEFQLLTAGRLNANWQATSSLKFVASYEVSPVVQTWKATNTANPGFGTAVPLPKGPTYRYADLEPTLSEDDHVIVYQNLDRLAAYWALSGADLSIGRQAITFGSARAIQPTDVLLPFSFQQLNVEYRTGVDAVRLQIPISEMGELDFGYVFGKELKVEESAAFARLQFSVFETDVTAIAMAFADAEMVGGGLQRGLWQLGYTLDFAAVFPENQPDYFRLSTGLDYSFASDLMIYLEYHFNGAGRTDPNHYFSLADDFAYQRGGVFLLGRNYLIPGMSYPFTPLLNAHLQVINNLQDGSFFASPSVEYNLSENLYVDGGLFLPIGPGPVTSTTGPTAKSEFGLYPTQLYAAIRYYY